MTLIAAALVRRCHAPVYQLATSVTNPCDMRRSIELTSLAHRIHYREQRGFLSWWKARADAIPVSKIRYMRLSAPSYQALQRAIRRLFHPLSARWGFLTRFERATNRVAKLIEIYEPFILHNDHVFEARNVEILSSALPPEERERFAYDAASIDWKEYWIDLHVPAMRRWCYPLLEGRTIGTAPRRAFRLPDLPGAGKLPGIAEADRDGVGREASWRPS
jgi:long-chain acyl-CoA synthetase